jgi:metallothionein
MSEPKKCGNSACSCMPEKGQSFCSTHCEGTKGTTEIICECGTPLMQRRRNEGLAGRDKRHLDYLPSFASRSSRSAGFVAPGRMFSKND